MIHAGHFVAIIGGAVSGAEAAHQLAEKRIYSVVFEQNPLPYGKIEDGLPKWHAKLRDREEEIINQHLDTQPYVHFVPRFNLGRDISFQELLNWGFSAILLATGASQDRKLPVDGVEEFRGRGLYYQNPFVRWFNHNHEPDYSADWFKIHDNAIIVGGGLASIDVAKILMIETVKKGLKKMGHDVDVLTLEHKGVAKVLAEYGMTLQDLGLKGCSLYYRRRVIDMPLVPLPDDARPEKLEKAKSVREKILKNAQEKYLFKFYDQHMPVEGIVEGHRLNGLIFQRTNVVNGKAVPIPDSRVEVKSPLVISSIGSIPKPIEGIGFERSGFKLRDPESSMIEGFDNVFAIGNAVTGRGNIKESRTHGKKISEHIVTNFLQWEEQRIESLVDRAEESAGKKTHSVLQQLGEREPLSLEQIASLIEKVENLQDSIDYIVNYRDWIKRHIPTRLEQIIELTT